MCCRCFLRVSIKDVFKHYFETMENLPSIEYEPREIFPTDKVPVVHRGKKVDKTIHLMKWGFAPSYMDKLVINARSETIHEKKMFSEAFFRRRCLIPVSGYYEWEKVENDEGKIEKIKREITVPDRDIISLAGVYDRFDDKDGQLFWAITLLTKDANDSVKGVHDRMPVVLEDKDMEDAWIGQYKEDYTTLYSIIKNASPRFKVK